MDSYVTLTLKDYNDLYDMAKRYLEMTQVELVETTEEPVEDIKPVENIEEPVETNEEWDVILVEDCDGIPKGAKGKDLQPGNTVPFIAWDKNYDVEYGKMYKHTIDGITYKNVWSIERKYLKPINEREDN